MMRTNISGKKKFIILCSLFAVLSIPLIYLKAIHTFVKNPFYIDKIKSAWQGAEYLGNEGVYLQNKANNCGPVALKMFLDRKNVRCTIKELEILSNMSAKGTTIAGLVSTLNAKGVEVEAWKLTFDDLKKTSFPAIAYIKRNHFVVVEKIDKINDGVYVLDPAIGRLKLTQKAFLKLWKGIAIIAKK